MLKSIKYVLKENFSNLFRIYSISKYELLSDKLKAETIKKGSIKY